MDAPIAAAPAQGPATGKLAPQARETKRAAAVAKEVVAAPVAEKKQLRIDQKLLMSECQLLLAEKRTAYAMLRTGVSVSLIPVSIWTVLVATSRMWNVFDVLWLLVPVMLVATALLVVGLWLIGRALLQLRHVESTLDGLKRSDTLLETLLHREREWREWVGARAARMLWRGGGRRAT